MTARRFNPLRSVAEEGGVEVGTASVAPSWLALREPADGAARCVELVELARTRLPERRPLEVHDLGCGTASMARWLVPQLPGPQHWVLHDRDADLLALARRRMPRTTGDGRPVTAETRHGDLTRLEPAALAGASLIAASALLDILSVPELVRLVTLGATTACPVLISLTVVGIVELAPSEPMDSLVAAAFDAHQRRTTTRGRLLGPDAVATAADAFEALGWQVHVRPSPWRLGPADASLIAEWLTGWVSAACEQNPSLAGPAAAYLPRRTAQAARGLLDVTVRHADLLALPPSTGPT